MAESVENSQLRTILNGLENGNILGMNKIEDDGHFYVFGASAKPSSSIYETNPAIIREKIKNFVSSNENKLKPKLLENLTNRLDNRITKTQNQTFSLLKLIHFLFNFTDRSRYWDNTQLDDTAFMAELKRTIEQAMAKVKLPVYPVFPQESTRLTTTPLHTRPTAPYQSPVRKPMTIPQPITPKAPNLNNSNPTPNSNARDGITPIQNPPPFPTFDPPPFPGFGPPTPPSVAPPTPPGVPPVFPTHLGPRIPIGPRLFENEPAPLTFSFIGYRTLSKEEVAKQLPQIDEYLTALKLAIKPVEDLLKQEEELTKTVKDKYGPELAQAESELANLQADLDELSKAEAKGVITSLIYKTSKAIDIPYIPDETYKNIQDRVKVIEQNIEVRKLELDQLITPLKLAIETSSDLPVSSEIEAKKKLLEQYEAEKQKLNNTPKQPLKFPQLQLSKAIATLKQIISDLNKSIKELKEQLEKVNSDLAIIHKVTNNTIPFAQFKSLIASKKKLIEDWERNLKGRKEFINGKAPANRPIIATNGPKEIHPIYDEYPELSSLLGFTHTVELTINNPKEFFKSVFTKENV